MNVRRNICSAKHGEIVHWLWEKLRRFIEGQVDEITPGKFFKICIAPRRVNVLHESQLDKLIVIVVIQFCLLLNSSAAPLRSVMSRGPLVKLCAHKV